MVRFSPPLRLPRVFSRDRAERDLSVGTGRFTSSAYLLSEITREDLADFRSDARHYAQDGVDECDPGLIRSAKAAYRILAAQ